MIDSETDCIAAAAAVGVPFAAVAGSEWASGCLFHGGNAYYSPHDDASTQDPTDAYICGALPPVCEDDDAFVGQLFGDASITCAVALNTTGACGILANAGYPETCCASCANAPAPPPPAPCTDDDNAVGSIFGDAAMSCAIAAANQGCGPLANAGYSDICCASCANAPPPTPPCQANNAYDDAGNAGGCAGFITGGSMTCAGDFAFGMAYQGYCDLECGYDLYDSSQEMGGCASFIAGGMDCASTFALGMQYSSYCDFSCGYCAAPAPPPGCTDDDAAASQLFGQALLCSDVAAGGACPTLANAGYPETCCVSCAGLAPPPPPAPCQDLLPAADCATYIGQGMDCTNTFCPTCSYAGYCDNTCGNTTCTAECQTTLADAAGNSWSCANAVEMGQGPYYTCPLLVLQGNCANCPTCSNVPATLQQDGTCITDALTLGFAAVGVCLSADQSSFTCDAAGCLHAVQAMAGHFSNCTAVNFTEYDPLLGQTIDAMRGVESFCNPNACTFYYNAIYEACYDPATSAMMSCGVAACETAISEAQANVGTCDNPEFLAEAPFFTTLSEYAGGQAAQRGITCTAGCEMPDLDAACTSAFTDGMCSPTSACANITAPFVTNLLGATCEPLYRVAGYDDEFFTTLTHLQLMCTGQASFGSFYDNATGLVDSTTTYCLGLHSTAQAMCASAGLTIDSPNRCGDPSCYAAVNHLLLMHDTCLAHVTSIATAWPLAVADFQVMAATNSCPCMDHDLSAYGFGSATCAAIAGHGGCHQNLHAYNHLTPDVLMGADVCCQSCQAADTGCVDLNLCSASSPLASLVNFQLPGICDADVSSVLMGQMAGTTFNSACPVTCGTCVSFDECDSAPCQNGGACVDHVDRYECLCNNGWVGSECEQAQGLIIPSNLFCQVQSMGYTAGTGDANDLTSGCANEYAAAQATTESRGTDGVGTSTGANTFEYFTNVVQANAPYCPDNLETQEFIDLYVCAAGLTVGYNGTPLDLANAGSVNAVAGEHACGGQIGMDYGGNPSYITADGSSISCGYATTLVIFADSASWPAPGWYAGTVTVDTTMDSPLECQARCLQMSSCDYFSYEWELTGGNMFHECYLKTAYADPQCMVNPYVPWSSQDAQWHGQSGPGIACATPVETEMACGGQMGMDYGGNPSYGGPEGCSSSDAATTCALTAATGDVSEACTMTLATGIVEETDVGAATVCTLTASTDAGVTPGTCAVSGGGTTPGTCTYQAAASAAVGSCAAATGTGTCTYTAPATSCGYAPVVELVRDDAGWSAPGWFSGTLTTDATMVSPLQCQARCLANAACDYFSYEWELTGGNMFHECYLKASYADAQCMVNPYVPWSSQDAQWHGQSGPGIACASPTELEHACDSFVGMDFGGNPIGADGVECGYAPVVAIFADSASWPAPGWYSGPVILDLTMVSPLECQARCFAAVSCDYFSYEWELTANGMYHECYLKTAYTEARCQANPYVPWSSQDTQWHGQSGPGIACATPVETEMACGGQMGMDYGGNPSYTAADGSSVSCGYAPVIELVADNAAWPAPGWFSGTLTTDATMVSPLQCQARCLANAACDYFSYEWELTGGNMFHECYLKASYADAQCMVNPYVPWSSQDAQWHGQSGPGIACASPTELEHACDSFVGMDFGGNPIGADGVECGYAPVVAIFADHADWSPPGWYSGPLFTDAGMDSPLECQARCFAAVTCDYFSYEWELTAGGMYHECYLKQGYTEARCQANPYVPWSSQNAQWHGQSGPGIQCFDTAVTCPPITCAGDVSGDNMITTTDLLAVLSAFGSQDCAADQDRSDGQAEGTITTDDLLVVLSQFGRTCAGGGR